MVCDVRDADALQRLADTVHRDIGPVRLLVNNAGVEQFGYLWDTPVAELEPRRPHQHQRRLPRRAGVPAADDGGAATPAWVWNLSSIGGVAAVPLQAPYIMSKHAVLALTECLRLEVELAGHADHVHVQAVLPGAVKSNIFEAAGGVDDGDVAAAE